MNAVRMFCTCLVDVSSGVPFGDTPEAMPTRSPLCFVSDALCDLGLGRCGYSGPENGTVIRGDYLNTNGKLHTVAGRSAVWPGRSSGS